MSEHTERLEYLRGEIRAERISMSELLELQGLAEHIDPSDVELLEWAGVPEFPEPRCDACDVAMEDTPDWCGECGNCTEHCAQQVGCPDPPPPTRRRLRTTQSRLGGNFIAVCDHCDYVCVYWDYEDLDADGHLYHDCEVTS